MTYFAELDTLTPKQKSELFRTAWKCENFFIQNFSKTKKKYTLKNFCNSPDCEGCRNRLIYNREIELSARFEQLSETANFNLLTLKLNSVYVFEKKELKSLFTSKIRKNLSNLCDKHLINYPYMIGFDELDQTFHLLLQEVSKTQISLISSLFEKFLLKTGDFCDLLCNHRDRRIQLLCKS